LHSPPPPPLTHFHQQDECLREESRYHYLQHLIGITRIKIDRAEQEKAWQKGKGRMMRDFAHLKEFYTVCFVFFCVQYCDIYFLA